MIMMGKSIRQIWVNTNSEEPDWLDLVCYSALWRHLCHVRISNLLPTRFEFLFDKKKDKKKWGKKLNKNVGVLMSIIVSTSGKIFYWKFIKVVLICTSYMLPCNNYSLIMSYSTCSQFPLLVVTISVQSPIKLS